MMKPIRSIKTGYAILKIVHEDIPEQQSEFVEWLNAKGNTHDFMYLLAHCDDGIIWGKWKDDRWVISAEAELPADVKKKQQPELRLTTLWHLRMFSESAELFMWRRYDETWQARIITDGHKDQDKYDKVFKAYIDEEYLLWGNRYKQEFNGFTSCNDGEKGFEQILPVAGQKWDEPQECPYRLKVRHYLLEDLGNYSVSTSRLTGFAGEKGAA